MKVKIKAKASMKAKIEAKVITTMHKYHRMKDRMLIMMTMIMIRMITNNMTMTLRAIGEMNLRLTNLMMIVIMIQTILVNLRTLLL